MALLSDSRTAAPGGAYLPSEIWAHILGYLDFRGMQVFGALCVQTREILCDKRDLKFGQVRLSPAQAEIRRRLSAMKAPKEAGVSTHSVCAPMGFGKTILAYATAFLPEDDDERYVIVVPAKAFDTWVHEAHKIFGDAAAPSRVTEATRVLFVRTSKRVHYRYVSDALEAATQGGVPPAFSPAVRAMVVTAGSRLGEQLMRTWGTRAIVDEAHAATMKTWAQLGRYRWVVTLSANAIPGRADVPPPPQTVVRPGYMSHSVPRVALRRAVIAPCAGGHDEEREYAPSEARADLVARNLVVYCEEIGRVLARVPPGVPAHVALYLPDGEAGRPLVDALPALAAGWQVIPFTDATSKIRKFEVAARSVLVLRLSKSEALNIRASHLVLVRPDWVNHVRYGQLIGRVLRPTSRHAEVEVTVVVPRGVPAHRAACYEARRQLHARGLELRLPDYRAAELARADAVLRVLGTCLEDAAPPEALAALGAGFDSPAAAPRLLELWAAEAAPRLARGQVETLLTGAAAPCPALSDREINDLLGL